MDSSDGYGIDLNTFSLDTLRNFLAHGDLLPGHRMLRTDLEPYFAALAARDIHSVQQLVNQLTTPKAVATVAAATGIPLVYLTVLRRHVRGYIPAAVDLDAIPDVDAAVITRLAEAGIRHTHHLYTRARTRVGRAALMKQADIPDAIMLELIQLTDLARVSWIGPIGVRLYHAAGAFTTTILAAMDPDTFYQQVMAVNRERQYTRAKITSRDMVRTIALAKQLPPTIEY